MKSHCKSFNAENPGTFLGYYDVGKQFFNETQHRMNFQLLSVSLDILTDRDVDITNKIIPDVETFLYYHLTIIPANNQAIHVHISNNTFRSVYLHLDNSKMSVHITNNVFTGAGIKISSTSTDLHEPVIIENCIFQGFYFKTIFQALNTTNVYLYCCAFSNSKLVVLPDVDDNESSGMLCFNSQIGLRDILFRSVSFFPVTTFENCTLAIYQITMSENMSENMSESYSFLSQPGTNSLLYLKHSEAIIENSKFEGNRQGYCFWVVGGNTSLHNVLFGNNNDAEYARFVDATVNITNTSILNNMDFIFIILRSTVSISSCKFRKGSSLSIQESHVSINDCIFKEIQRTILIQGPTELFIRGCHFLLKKDSISLIQFFSFEEIPESFLYMSDCRFESNGFPNVDFEYVGSLFLLNSESEYSGLIEVRSVSTVIENTVFYHNNVTTLVFGKYIEFRNCVFNSNFASQGVVWVNDGTMQFSNCSFSNNVGSLYHGIVDVKRGQLSISNCTFTNNTSPHIAGVIAVAQDSSLLVENSMFVANSCGVKAGAIKAQRNCTLIISNSTFKNNKALGADGGAIILEDESSLVSDNCQFLKNTAALGGGAVMVVGHSLYTDRGSIFMNNTAVDDSGDGAISTREHSLLRLENSTFEYNSCAVEGGAIRAHRNSILIIADTVFHSNKALGADGGAIFLEAESQLRSDSCQFIGNTAALGGGAVMVVDHSSYSDTGSTFINNSAADNGAFFFCITYHYGNLSKFGYGILLFIIFNTHYV